ncbi:IS110 family transposase, partial [Arthrobacter sp. 2MCAF14]|uniref:IS110 family transposase n=1 Tax=Arthrobacter sp. 2MCAF14 TaxID=3232982 RepID=UPI003F8F55C6
MGDSDGRDVRARRRVGHRQEVGDRVRAHPGAGRWASRQTRTFRTMTRSLELMRDLLVGRGVTLAAMESTSTYWKPVFYALEERMECWLLNAAHMKAVPGRKTDVKDAE